MTKLLCLNQMAGPLFRQLVEKIADSSVDLVELVSSHPDLFDNPKNFKKFSCNKAPTYNRNSESNPATVLVCIFSSGNLETNSTQKGRCGDSVHQSAFVGFVGFRN